MCETETCALCIIGAGASGLNALDAALDYLPDKSSVIVVDRGSSWGGHWNNQYEYLRLHQPYQFFTAGSQPWSMVKDRCHLATRAEVLTHFADCAERSAERARVIPFFGYEYDGTHAIREGAVEVVVRPTLRGGPIVKLRADRLILAMGYDIPLLDPLPLRSQMVRSVSARDPQLTSTAMNFDDAPVYIIGSGKTAMDCAHKLITQAEVHPDRPRKRIVMIAGSGSFFAIRERCFTPFPQSACASSSGFLDLFQFFIEGVANDRTMRDILRGLVANGTCTSLLPETAEHYRGGLISLDEMETIRKGLSEVIKGHLVDVEDVITGAYLILKSEDGSRQRIQIEPNAWIVNCTGHLRGDRSEPLISGGGLVLSPQTALVFPAPTYWLLTHAFYKLGASHDLWDRLRAVLPSQIIQPTAWCAFINNSLAITSALPSHIVMRCEMMKIATHWFPWPHTIWFMARFLCSVVPLWGRYKASQAYREMVPYAKDEDAEVKEMQNVLERISLRSSYEHL